MNVLLVFLILICPLRGQFVRELTVESSTSRQSAESGTGAQESRDTEPKSPLKLDSSDGAMEGVNLSRTNVYPTKGVTKITAAVWKSTKLFDTAGMTSFNRGSIVGSINGSAFLTFSEPVLAGRILFFRVHLGNGVLFAMDAETGIFLWNLQVKGGAISAPAVAAETAYAVASDGNLYAVDARTGREEWKFKCKQLKHGGGTSPAVSNRVVYFGCGDGKLYSLETETGKEKWTFNAQAWLTPAALAEGSVFIASEKGYLYALDSETGIERWNYVFKGDPGTPVYGGGVVYLRTQQGDLHAIDAKTGQSLWKVRLGDKKHSLGAALSGIKRTSLALYDGALYFGEIDGLYAVEAKNGQLRWQFETESPCRPPVIADGVVYIGGGGRLVAVDAKLGRQVGVVENREKVDGKTMQFAFSSPAISNGVLYVVSSSGHTYALK